MIIPTLNKLDTPGQFFGKMFHSRDTAHLEHLKTKSFEQHKALNDYYDGVLDLIDSLVESYQGKYGIVEIVIDKTVTTEPVKYFEALGIYIENNKDKIFKDSWILNQIDGISELVYSTLYKLKNLK